MARKKTRRFDKIAAIVTKKWLFIALAIASFLFTFTSKHVPAATINTPISQSPIPNHQSPISQSPNSQLIEEGREYYRQSQFSQAIQIWQTLASSNQLPNIERAMVWSNLSLAYQQLGQWELAQKALNNSFDILATQPTTESAIVFAQTLNTQGRLQLALGETESALKSWQQAEIHYQQANNEAGLLKSRINQAQALKILGFYRRALDILSESSQQIQTLADSHLKAAGLRSLGNAFLLVGNFDRATENLQLSLQLAQQINSAPDISAAWYDLGNTARSQQQLTTAQEYYQQAATQATSPSQKLDAQLAQLSIFIEKQSFSAAEQLIPEIKSELDKLPISRQKIYAQIDFATNLSKLAPANTEPNSPYLLQSAELLASALKQAKSLSDSRATTYALGNLGKLYEQTQQLSTAKNLTEKALLIAQAINAPDIAYRWQWQLGRLLKAEAKIEPAIFAYTQAVNTLQSLRSDLVAINPDVQFSFRETVEPVYRQLVSLLLQPGDKPASQENIAQARDVIESLRVAELDNFFREACITIQPVQVDRVDKTAAVFYPIILEDRLEVILSLPEQPLRHYATNLPRNEVEAIVAEMRQNLVIRSKRDFLSPAQEIYNWLIRPAEADLRANKIQTLVFTLDGSLRNIPMATLYDGNSYLIERYSVALTPGLQLLDPQPLQQVKLASLTAGITEARQGFSPLENVSLEVEEIKSELPSKVLLNSEFTREAFRETLESSSFPVVHVATHGQFSSNAEDTFILTWEDRIDVKQLDDILQSVERKKAKPIELLVLSACQTAVGDKRAALGLAGVAVRAGARSTLATLWFVSDRATAELMGLFYQDLTDTSLTKAESLRQAQIALLQNPQFEHPIYWSPYVLVGNWL
ncbi:MAG: CHAT domain-containing protein [Oscillatoria sp. PMC 1051.18]|nr:CHAT domain-containing protein [Oscillatoria sp. PMC 1050.18]MEC5028838.1 CHAT domain-containing protein [Oscillatoria sp. PMC 1051.18]